MCFFSEGSAFTCATGCKNDSDMKGLTPLTPLTENVSVDRVEQQLTEFAALLRKLFGQTLLRQCFGHALETFGN